MNIENISLDQLDTLFGESPIETPAETKDTPAKIQDDNILTPNDALSSLPEVDLEAFEDGKVKVAEPTPEVDSKEPKKSKADVEPVSETPEDVKSVLKNTVSFLIDKGIWQDFEGREEIDLDEETYAELAFQQNQTTVQELFNELLDSTGDYGKAIISHIKEGGSPDEIIDLFKEQKGIESIDTSTDEGKLEKISTYYSEVLDWKPERIRKHLKRVIETKELDSELADIDEQYDKYYQVQLAEIAQEREAQKQVFEQRKREFVTNLATSLDQMGYTSREKKFLSESILVPKQLPNGQVTTDFNYRFSQIQQDPQKLIKLVEFVMDENKFINKIEAQAESKAAEKAFKFVKGNAAVSKAKTNHAPDTDKSNNLDFSSLLKR